MDVPSGLGLPRATGGSARSALVIAVPDTAIATTTSAAKRGTCWRRVSIVRKRVMRVPSSVSTRVLAFPRTTQTIDRRFPPAFSGEVMMWSTWRVLVGTVLVIVGCAGDDGEWLVGQRSARWSRGPIGRGRSRIREAPRPEERLRTSAPRRRAARHEVSGCSCGRSPTPSRRLRHGCADRACSGCSSSGTSPC